METLHRLGSRIRHLPFLKRQTWLWERVELVWQWLFSKLAARNGFAAHINEDVFRLEYGYASRYDRFDKRQYEPAFYQAFVKEIHEGMHVVDIGAHIGILTLAAAKRVGPVGRVYAFEPADETVQILRRHVAFNSWRDRVEVIPAVVSDIDGTIPFFVNGASMAASIGRKNIETLNPESRSSPAQMIETQSMRLDTFCESRRITPQVVKVDVEGAELLVLRGARNLLLNNSLVVLCEIHPAQMQNCGSTMDEFKLFLAEIGYELQPIDEPNPMGIFHARCSRSQAHVKIGV